MRRLPVYFLVDVSESMVGECLYQVEEALAAIVANLRTDPYALETAYLSVIAFAGKAKTITPLTELADFYPPDLPVGGGTSLGAGLNHLMDEIDSKVHLGWRGEKGDWRPVVFLLTDGHPTDKPAAAVERWNKSYRARASLVAVSVGGLADHSVLRQLSDDVVALYDVTPESFAHFAQWVSASVSEQSRSVGTGNEVRISLSKADTWAFSVPLDEDEAQGPVFDERFAVFTCRCEQSGLPYIIKYERWEGVPEGSEAPSRRREFKLACAMPVKSSYFDLSDAAATRLPVQSSDLVGQPSCPHCGAAYGLARCGCGGIHCVDGGGPHICPWCHEVGIYESGAGNDGFDVARGLG